MKQLISTPNSNFSAIRDGRTSLPLYIDIDLSSARSISANTHLILDIAGNSFYSDADTTNGGNAVVHFQDTNLGNSSAPFFVSPGFIANVGFTKLLIENTAQIGKRARIFYGVDIDFQAGVNSSISISGTVGIVQDTPNPWYDTFDSSYASITNMAVNTPSAVFLPAANTNGIIVSRAFLRSTNTTASTHCVLIANTVAPANNRDGAVILAGVDYGSPGTASMGSGCLDRPILIPAGNGLWFITDVAETDSYRSVIYRSL